MITLLIDKSKRIWAFIKSDGFKRYFSNTGWLLADNMINLIAGFIIGILVARYLGANDFGLLSFSRSTAKIFSIFCSLGIEKIAIKHFVNSEQNHATVMGTGLIMKIGAAIFCIFLVAILGPIIFLDPLTYKLVLIFTSVTIFEAFLMIRFYFQSRVETKYVSRVVTIKILISTLAKYILVEIEAPLIYFAFEALLEALLGVIGFIIVYHKRTSMRISMISFNLTYAKALLKEIWPLWISGFVVFVYMEIDILIIKYLLGNEQVGHYAIATRLTNIWNMLGIVICSSLFPAILNAKKKNLILFEKRFLDLLRLLVVLSFIIIILGEIGGEWFIKNLFGILYAPAVPPFRILILTVVFVNLGIASQQWHVAEGLQKMLLFRTTLGAFINIILNIVLIPSLGIIGAAYATLIAQFSATYLSNAFSDRTMKLFQMQSRSLIFFR